MYFYENISFLLIYTLQVDAQVKAYQISNRNYNQSLPHISDKEFTCM